MRKILTIWCLSSFFCIFAQENTGISKKIDFNRVNKVIKAELEPILIDTVNSELAASLPSALEELGFEFAPKLTGVNFAFSEDSNLVDKLNAKISIGFDGTPWNGESDPANVSLVLDLNREAEVFNLSAELKSQLKTADALKLLATSWSNFLDSTLEGNQNASEVEAAQVLKAALNHINTDSTPKNIYEQFSKVFENEYIKNELIRDADLGVSFDEKNNEVSLFLRDFKDPFFSFETIFAVKINASMFDLSISTKVPVEFAESYLSLFDEYKPYLIAMQYDNSEIEAKISSGSTSEKIIFERFLELKQNAYMGIDAITSITTEVLVKLLSVLK